MFRRVSFFYHQIEEELMMIKKGVKEQKVQNIVNLMDYATFWRWSQAINKRLKKEQLSRVQTLNKLILSESELDSNKQLNQTNKRATNIDFQRIVDELARIEGQNIRIIKQLSRLADKTNVQYHMSI